MAAAAAAAAMGALHCRSKSRITRSISPSPLPSPPFPPPSRSITKFTVVEEMFGVRVEHNPPESRLSDLGVRSWFTRRLPPSKYFMTYGCTETCYLLKGKVKVYGESSSEYIEISAGDLVVFPVGTRCTWDVSEAVNRHFSFS